MSRETKQLLFGHETRKSNVTKCFNICSWSKVLEPRELRESPNSIIGLEYRVKVVIMTTPKEASYSFLKVLLYSTQHDGSGSRRSNSTCNNPLSLPLMGPSSKTEFSACHNSPAAFFLHIKDSEWVSLPCHKSVSNFSNVEMKISNTRKTASSSSLDDGHSEIYGSL